MPRAVRTHDAWQQQERRDDHHQQEDEKDHGLILSGTGLVIYSHLRKSGHMSPVPSERRISAPALARLLGTLPPHTPGYQAVADATRRCILDGSLPLHTRIPSERELAETLGVSRTTTAAAFERLRSSGFLLTRRGSGSVTTVPHGPDGAAGAAGAWSGQVADSPGAPVDLTLAAPSAPTQLHGAAQRALEALPRHLAGTGYTFLGLPALRAALAERYTRRGTPTSPEEILVTTGAQQAIYLLMASFTGQGDRVVVEHPAYPHAIAAVRGVGGRPVPVPVGRGGVDLDLLESTIRQSAPRLVHLTPDFHNPTGATLDPQARERLREMAARYRTPVVGDETLTDLALDGPAPACVLGTSPGQHLLAIGSASKSFWGGLRVGWVRARADVIARLGQERARHDLSTGLLDQLITLELLAEEDVVLAERRVTLRLQRDALLAAVERELPWRVERPAGGLSTWADLGAPLSSALAAIAPQHGVVVVPGTIFGVDGAFENRLRLPFAIDVERLERGVLALASAWRVLDQGARAGSSAENAVLV